MAWRHHFLVLLRFSRCIQVKFEKSERKPKRQRGRRSTAFIPFTTADSSTHFRLNQFSGLRRPKTIISWRQAFPHLQKQDKSGRIVASDSDQSAKVVPRVRPISDDQTPGSNRSFGINCLIRRCTEGHFGICANCCLKVGSDAVGMISAWLREVGTVHMDAEEK